MDLGEEHFRTMTYKEAMTRFGSDKPDTRFGLEIVDVSEAAAKCDFKVFKDALAINGILKGSVRAINAKGFASKLSRKDIDALGEYVKTLGCENTHFANPHGLDDEKHRVTARDLALISAYAMDNDTFKEIMSRDLFAEHIN